MKHNRFEPPTVPPELHGLSQWVGSQDGRPKNPRFPRQNASTNDSSTWSSFDDAIAGLAAGHFDGVAFVFTADDPYMGIDLDACRDPETGEITDWAQEIVDALDTYTEISRSGTGLHLLLRTGTHAAKSENCTAKLKNVATFGSKEPEIRVSGERQALTLTGKVLDGRSKIQKRSKALQTILARYATRKPANKRSAVVNRGRLARTTRKILEHLLLRSAASSDRSGQDFYLCCVAIRLGASPGAVWRLVRHASKFGERERDYFDQTWERAEEAVEKGLRNAIAIPGDDREAISLSTLVETISRLTDNWPRRVGQMLFIHDPLHGIGFLKSTSGLFAWLHSAIGSVQWFSSAGCVTKEELFAELQRVAPAYDSLQQLPYEPAIPNIYSEQLTPEPGDGTAFEGLIDCFVPATAEDRTLIKAAFLTVLWGGSPGARPIFVITADGRGHGKTTLTTLISILFYGALSFHKGEDIQTITQRLLSPEGLKSRMVVLDNLKTTRFSWAEFEALITADWISGKQMYVGEARRPNLLTYFITGNAPALSTDIAQRSVIIRLGKPTHSGDFFPEVRAYIEEHRTDIIADMIGILRSEAIALPQHSRWGEWEDGVLAHLSEAVAAQQLILKRRGESDVEAAQAATIEAYIRKRLEKQGFNPETQRIRIRTEIIVQWYHVATGQQDHADRVSRQLRQMSDEGQLKFLSKSKSNKQARSFIWTGPQAGESKTIDFDKRPGRS